MKKNEIIQELIKIHELAQSELEGMSRYRNHADVEDDFVHAWVQGFEDATEYFENHIDELSRLIRSLEIDSVMTNTIIPSDKQKPLF